MLAEAGDSIKRFFDPGISELRDRLGPVLWQFAPTRNSTKPISENSWNCCRANIDGLKLRHVVEVRHDSFKTPAFIALLRQFGIAVVYSRAHTYPAIADVVGDFVYARLQKGNDDIKTCYPPKALDAWAARLKVLGRRWRTGRPAQG